MAVSLRQADLTNGVSRDRANRRNGRASAALGREVSDYVDPPETGQIQICLAFAPRCLLALIFPANLMLSFSASASAVMLSHPQIAVSNVGRGPIAARRSHSSPSRPYVLLDSLHPPSPTFPKNTVPDPFQ